MKKWLPVGAALLAVAVLLGGISLLRRTPSMPTQPQITPAPALVLLDKEGVSPIQITLSCESETTTYEYNPQTGLYAASAYDERLAFNQAALARLFSSVTRLVSRKKIEEAPKDPTLYGMDSPICTVEALYQDGSRHRLQIGSRSPLEDGYFGMLDDDPGVYLLSTYDAESFLKRLYDYRSPSLFHTLGEDAEYYALTVREVLIDLGDAQRLHLTRAADGANGEVHSIQIDKPVTANGDEYAFYQKVIIPIFSLNGAKLVLVEDNPTDLAQYGLDAPATLLLRDDEGQTRLLIGNDQAGRTYLMREGVPAVLSVKTSALAFLKLDYSQIMDRLIWIYNIDRVQSLTIARAGRTDILEVSGGKRFVLNGSTVEDEKGRAIYRSAISLMYEERVVQTAAHGQPECVLTLTMLDGTQTSLSLYALNERQLEVARDGVSTGFYTNKSGLRTLLEALE